MRKWLFGFLRWLPAYWTNWSMGIFLYETLSGFPQYLRPSVKLVLCISSVGGLWITYYKKKLTIRGYFPIDITLKGIPLIVADVVSHQLPLGIFIAKNNYEPYEGTIVIAYILLLLYVFMNPIYDRYRIGTVHVIGGLCVTHILHHALP